MQLTSVNQPLKQAFTVVEEINQLAGNRANQGWSAVDHQMKIVASEWDELNEAVALRDPTALRDGAADLLFTLVGLAHRAGFDLLEDLLEVNRSNYTKFDVSEADALKTKAKYDALGIRTETVVYVDGYSEKHVTKVKGNQTVNGKDYPHAKWLKSHRFDDVHFTPLADNHPLNRPAPSFQAPELGVVAEEVGTVDPAVNAASADDDKAVIAAELPNRLAVKFIRDSIAYIPEFSRAMELWLAQKAYHRSGVDFSSKTFNNTGSSMAVTGAQRFLDILLLPDHRFQASLSPRYFSDRNPTPVEAEAGIESLLEAFPHPAAQWTFHRAIRTIQAGMMNDHAWQLSWHANLTMAWVDSGLSHENGRQLASAIMLALFGIDTNELYAPSKQTTDDASQPAMHSMA